MRFTRRDMFGLALRLAGGAAVATVPSLTAIGRARAAVPESSGLVSGRRYVIVNADDFGESSGINEGVIEAHAHGIVSSASLMVDAPDAEAAVALARRHPRLGLGIHVVLDRGGQHPVDPDDLGAVATELARQARRFIALTGRPPTHIDSHHHVHQRFNVARLFLDLGSRYQVPVRGFSSVVYVGRFYGDWTDGQSRVDHISADYLISLLHGLGPGVSEVSCHPGHPDVHSDAGYNRQREVELRVLIDERVNATVRAGGLDLINYADYGRLEGPRLARASGVPCPESPKVTRR